MTRQAAALVLVVLFHVVIWAPLAALVTGVEPVPVPPENRQLASRPGLATTIREPGEFPHRFEAYWNDAFGLRGALIRYHHLALLRLGVSASDKVMVGREGWLFLRSDSAADYDRAPPFTAAELTAWERTLLTRRDILTGRGVHYLMVIVPNKETIYPEFVAPGSGQDGHPTRLDQLLAFLGTRGVGDVLDVRDALRAAKTAGPVYFRTDSHWNQVGAFAAYRSIVERIARWFPRLAALPATAFEMQTSDTPGRDLAALLGLPDVVREQELTMRLREPRRAQYVDGGDPTVPVPPRLIVAEQRDGSLPRAVMFHDSFGDALIPFLSEHFARILYVPSTRLDLGLVEREAPDVVIQERAERYLVLPPP